MNKEAFAKLKNTSLDKTKALIDNASKKGGYSNELDELLYKPELDKSGNGLAIIRFLPQVDGEDSPFVKIYNHGFKINNRWYIENCPTTLGGQCPVCQNNSELYSSGIDSQKKIASSRSRKLSYYANIIVLSDPKNPDNEYSKSGKVFVFRFTKQIMDIINKAVSPEFEDDVAFNPFDFWKGANFRLKITTKQTGDARFPNYESSKFDAPSELFNGDENELTELWEKQHKLQPIVAPSKFSSFEDLSKKFYNIVGKQVPQNSHDEDIEEFDDVPVNKNANSSSSSNEDEDEDWLKDFDD